MLCGWTTTATRSYGTSYSQCASMTSRPLFMRVAESIVILAPMCQVGWARASAGRTVLEVGRTVAERAAGGRQDEPRDLAKVFAGEALPDRRVLRIDGPQPSQRAGLGVPRRRDAPVGRLPPGQRHDQVAARHQRLLVGRRHDLARGQRGQRGGQADQAAGGDDDQVHVVPRREGQERVGRLLAGGRRAAARSTAHPPRPRPAAGTGPPGRPAWPRRADRRGPPPRSDRAAPRAPRAPAGRSTRSSRARRRAFAPPAPLP